MEMADEASTIADYGCNRACGPGARGVSNRTNGDTRAESVVAAAYETMTVLATRAAIERPPR
jgi:hypothetical protein